MMLQSSVTPTIELDRSIASPLASELEPAAAPERSGTIATAQQSLPRAQRLPMFDAMRVLAALAVIFTHTAQSGLARKLSSSLQFGVAFFTVAAMILLARSLARRPNQKWLEYARMRLERVMGPLLIWTVIYVAFFYVMYRLFGRTVWATYGFDDNTVAHSGIGLLLGGAAIHLWYLPFILLACLAAFPLLKLSNANKTARYGCSLLLAALGYLCIRIPMPTTSYGNGVDVFLHYSIWTMPTLCWAVALAMVYPKHLNHQVAAWIVAAGVVLFLACSYASWHEMKSPLVRAGKGVAAGVISLAPWSPVLIQTLARLGQLSFGVYLVHLLFVHVTREAFTRVFGPTGLTGVLAQTGLVFVVSFACVYVCSKTRVGKLIFPG